MWELIELLIFLAGLGLGFIFWGMYAKPATEKRIALKLNPYLPVVYDYIDANMPKWLSQNTGDEIRKFIIDMLLESGAITEEESEVALSEIIDKYSPIVGADKNTKEV